MLKCPCKGAARHQLLPGLRQPQIKKLALLRSPSHSQRSSLLIHATKKPENGRHDSWLHGKPRKFLAHVNYNLRHFGKSTRESLQHRLQFLLAPLNKAKEGADWDDARGRMLYEYYNWRTGTSSDLQLFVTAFLAIVLGNAFLRSVIVDARPPQSVVDFWQGMYEVMVLSFGEDFPERTDSWAHQLFSIMVAGIGLASFALLLSLVEQVVLELIETNVRRGSRVYEKGHVCILGWCTSQRDLEVVWKMLEQLCYAYRNTGGTVVVVMTQKQKLEMESLFRRAIPDERRFGTRFVFRQGNPLVPQDLNMVSVTKAAATIVVSDQSRCPEEADAQSLRCAILIDELETDPADKPGGVIIEMKSSNAVPLLKYSCSERFTAINTSHFNARRLAKMVREPFIAVVSQQIMDFKNTSNTFVQHVPELVGCRFDECGFRFPDAIVMGVFKGKTNTAKLNPAGSYIIQPTDDLVLLRPTQVDPSTYKPLEEPVEVRCQDGWQPPAAQPCGCTAPSTTAAAPIPAASNTPAAYAAAAAAIIDGAVSSVVIDPASGSFPAHLPQPRTLSALQQQLQELQAPAALAETELIPGSVDGSADGNGGRPYEGVSVGNSSSTSAAMGGGGSSAIASGGGSSSSFFSAGVHGFFNEEMYESLASMDGADGTDGEPLPKEAVEAVAAGASSGEGGEQAGGPERKQGGSLDVTKQQSNAIFMVPVEYLVVDNSPKRVLICGWGEQSFMRAIMREFDSGQMALPPGSEVVFANTHSQEESLGLALKVVTPVNLKIGHTRVDPLNRVDLAKVDIQRFTATMVLCDEKWVDPDMDASNGVDELGQRDVLRLDSMVMVVQLNVRKLLEDSERPSINIICQKVAMEGLTRFEDRKRLPLGISVNFTAYAAKLLTHVAYNPRALQPYTRYGHKCDLMVIDSSELCAEGERVCFWELMRRAQMRQLVLIGWYHLPENIDSPVDVVLNPIGTEIRSRPRTWNKGDNAHKFVVLQNKGSHGGGSAQAVVERSVAASVDTDEEDSARNEQSYKQAQWVRLKGMLQERKLKEEKEQKEKEEKEKELQQQGAGKDSKGQGEQGGSQNGQGKAEAQGKSVTKRSIMGSMW